MEKYAHDWRKLRMDVGNVSFNWWYQCQKLCCHSTLRGVGVGSVLSDHSHVLTFLLTVSHLLSSNRQFHSPLCHTYIALFTFHILSRPLLCDYSKKRKQSQKTKHPKNPNKNNQQQQNKQKKQTTPPNKQLDKRNERKSCCIPRTFVFM